MDTNAQHSNKRVFLFALGAVALVVLLTLLATLSVNSGLKNSSQISTGSPPSSSSNTTKGSQQSSNSQTIEKGKTYKSSRYRIVYPSDWKTEEFSLPNGGTGVKITPVGSTDQTPPSIIVSSDNTTPISTTSQKEQVFIALGLKGDIVQLDNIPASRIKGTISSGNTASASGTDNVLQTTHIFVNRQGYNYFIEFTYRGKVDPVLEQTFSEVIASFKFLQ